MASLCRAIAAGPGWRCQHPMQRQPRHPARADSNKTSTRTDVSEGRPTVRWGVHLKDLGIVPLALRGGLPLQQFVPAGFRALLRSRVTSSHEDVSGG